MADIRTHEDAASISALLSLLYINIQYCLALQQSSRYAKHRFGVNSDTSLPAYLH